VIEMSLYQRIKYIADKKGIQYKDIATELNVSQNTVTNWFKGQNSMKAELIPIIAKYLRVSIDQLFQEVEMPLSKTYAENDKINEANEPCANCAAMQAKIDKLNEDLIESQKETIAALRGEAKKEMPLNHTA
jgi:transcriptional regulator with XRE-family HTH domain